MHTHTEFSHGRTRLLIFFLDLLFICIIVRLFYWQILHRSTLQAQAQDQYSRTVSLEGHRGKIFTSDGYPLVTNKTVYRLSLRPATLKEKPKAVAAELAPLLFESSAPHQTQQQLQDMIEAKLSDPKIKWLTLKTNISADTKQKIDALHIFGVTLEPYEIRDYPEASMAAHVTGFVGKDKDGNDQGYFGIEGKLDRELKGHTEQQTFLKDALGFHLLFDQSTTATQTDGRDVVLTLHRDVQHAVEEMLQQGMEKYKASAGEAIVMDPKTGKIIAMADFPRYTQANFYDYPATLYKNPALTETYEPGSTFKLITVAAGLDTKKITPETVCTNCANARHIDTYTIRTWNDQYHPNITMNDALAKSDNVAMIFVAELLGKERFLNYVHLFGIGDATHIELQEDTGSPIRKDWKFIDLATGSFGQGIVTTGIQMVRAVGAIANHGMMMRPTIIEKVHDNAQNTDVPVQPIEERHVISPETAATVAKMMVYAVDIGEAHWTASKTHAAAGKTGTAQVPIAGHYDATNTIASFIGFAPPENPRFVMLIKLRSPQTSPWAAETAAPLWFQIANKLFLLLNIPPDR